MAVSLSGERFLAIIGTESKEYSKNLSRFCNFTGEKNALQQKCENHRIPSHQQGATMFQTILNSTSISIKDQIWKRDVKWILVILLNLSVLFAWKVEDIDAVVRSYYETHQFSGTVLVAEAGQVIYRKSYGWANREWNIPNRPEAKYRIASISKQFTAMLILQLVSEGRLSLTGRITDYLPYYRKDTGRRITIHHLLTHTSGIPDLTDDPYFWDYETRLQFDLKTLVKKYCSGRLEFKPGTQFDYCNSGYVILGAIIEEVTGKDYETLLQERILKPLGLTNTGYDQNKTILPYRAAGYDYNYGDYQNANYFDMSSVGAAGALYSTVDDLFRWDQALYTDQLLPSEYLEKMMTPYLNNYAYGLGVYEVELPDSSRVTMVSHTGGIHGFNSRIARYVDQRHTVIILGNQMPINHTDMNVALRNILYEQPFQLALPSIADTLHRHYRKYGMPSAIELYYNLKNTASEQYNFEERELNTLGYYLLRKVNVDDAIAIFQLNVDAYPTAFNTYDSLGEAYLVKGDREKAIFNYKKSLELNPNNTNGKIMLKKARRLLRR
jgi:CubicO group peptidase (beta-lactamase class C family)